MESVTDTIVRINAPGFVGRIGIVDYIEEKSESHNGWNYSVLVFATDAMVSEGSEFYCFSRDELEFLGGERSLDAETVVANVRTVNMQERYTAYQFGPSTYVVYDQSKERDICVCADCKNGDLLELRAKLIVDALNMQTDR